MIKLTSALAAAALGLLLAGPAQAQSKAPLPLPEYGATADVEGAANRPDPSLNYKVVFDVAQAGRPGDRNAGLLAVARYLNTLAQHGVPPEGRNIAVVIHGPATAIIMTDAAYAQRTGAPANPNTKLIRDLKAAGVDLHVCGQAARGMNITREMAMPEITRDLAGGISLINFQTRGYVKAGD